VGSAPVLASYLKTAAEGMENETFIVHAGDFVGAHAGIFIAAGRAHHRIHEPFGQ
jgi:hypothetical protein